MQSRGPGVEWNNTHRAYWDLIAEEYDELYDDPWSKAEDAQTRLLLSRILVGPKRTILDLACGTGLGYTLSSSIRKDIQYAGLDISSKMVAKCRQKWPDMLVESGVMSDLSRFDSESFDIIVILYSSFSFTNKPRETLQEVYRVLKSNGAVLISVLSRWSLRKLLVGTTNEYESYRTRDSGMRNLSIPAWTYSRRKLTSLFETAGFHDVCVYGQGFFAGVLQLKLLWIVDTLLSSLFPNLCHILNVVAEKD